METENKELKEKIVKIKEKIDPIKKREEALELEKSSYLPDFWSDPKKAAEIMKRINLLKKEAEDIELIELLYEEGEIKEALKLILQYELTLFFSGLYDKNDVVFSIHSGQGGTEAMDWTEMLLRMYTRYFEKKNWKYEEIERVAGEEAGIKTVTLNVSGNFAYGHLKSEAGVHRLVRQSPFNADKLRQTSFALVEVLPAIEDKDIEIKDEDLEWEFFRSGGHGGQNVNKVSTAVRLVHKPSRIVVTCQTERSQLQNRENALKILRSRLWQIQEEKRNTEIETFKKDKMASWGRQIRSYVLHPYKLIKDLRTGYEENNAEKVLDGEIDGFIESYLKK